MDLIEKINMTNILVTIKEHPRVSAIAIFGLVVAIIGTIAGIRSCDYNRQSYLEKHTPKIEISEAFFSYEPIPDGNVTGIVIILSNQSNAWAKNVVVDFINDDGYGVKREKIKYLRGEKIITPPKEISPNDKILDGWKPQGPSLSPKIYRDGEKKYTVDIIINWENDKGDKYSLVRGYESIADNIAKQIRFALTYRYDSFKNKKKVDEIKKNNQAYLPIDML